MDPQEEALVLALNSNFNRAKDDLNQVMDALAGVIPELLEREALKNTDLLLLDHARFIIAFNEVIYREIQKFQALEKLPRAEAIAYCKEDVYVKMLRTIQELRSEFTS